MQTNNFKLFFRHLKKQGFTGIIRAIGLILGMLSTILILEYVMYQRSFDKDHGEEVYRIIYHRYGQEGLMWKTANFFVPAGPYLKDNFPEVEDYVTLRRINDLTISQTNTSSELKIFNFEKSYYATESLFTLFRYQLKNGTADCLSKPNMVALSAKAANMLFGKEPVLGREIELNHRTRFTVGAVYNDLPENSHLQSDLFFSYQTLFSSSPQQLNDWENDGSNTYIRLKTGTDYLDFQRRFAPIMLADHFADQQKRLNQRNEIFLQPVRSIHLDSHLEYELEPPGSGKAVTLLFYFSIFFLVIAWINSINLETAQSIERAKEIGVKRATGSSRMKLIRQFLSEALLFNLICFMATLFLHLLVDPFYRAATLIPQGFRVFDPLFLTFFAGALLAGTVLSALYPAFLLSSFKPVEVLKGRIVSSSQGFMLRKILVTFQFILSIILIAGTIVTYKQVEFLTRKDFGINYYSKLVLKAPKRAALGSQFYTRMDLLIDQLKQIPQVTDYTMCSDIPGKEIFGFFGGYLKGQSQNNHNWYFGIHTDHHFTSCFDARVCAGRSFREDDQPESRTMMINEAALKRFGLNSAEDAIGKTVIGHDHHEYQIIGVFSDFHYYSVKVAPVATCFTNQINQRKYVVLKTKTTSKAEVQLILSSAREAYRQIFPDQPFDGFFLQDLVAEDLKPDKTFVAVFGVFSVLALLIALIGIIALLLIFTLQNMKTFGIRKVFGAKMLNIYLNLSRPFIPQVIVASCIGLPLAGWGLTLWMSKNYISHIIIKPVYLILPVVLITGILAIVLLFMAVKTSKMKVVKVIKYE